MIRTRIVFIFLQKALIIFSVIPAFQSCHDTQYGTSLSAQEFPIDSNFVSLSKLPNAINESSGIIYFEEQLWTQNDSGDDPKLYKISNQNDNLLQTVKLLNIKNIDWEGLAQDSSHLYIGDFGNNGGRRQDLVIYKILKADLAQESIANIEKIAFAYADQTRFDYEAYEHNFDCEAMISVGDSLYLFSKNFKDEKTRLYSLPKFPGEYVIPPKAEFNVKGSITDAAINKQSDILSITGYNFNHGTFSPFIWVFWDYENQDFFMGKNQRVNLPVQLQIEGITHFKENLFFVSSEAESGGKGKLFQFDAGQWME